MARRLVEAGVRFVTVTYGAWDIHSYHYRGIETQLPDLDKAFAGLIQDLDQRGLLDSTLVLIISEFGNNFEVIYPSRTILAENPVSVVDKVVDKHGTRKQAEAYLKWLWSPQAQEIAAQHGLRPRDAAVLAKHAKTFPKVNTFTVEEVFGSWLKAQKEHFDDGALYDQILAANRK